MDDARRFPSGITSDLIEETRQTFQPYYSEPLTDEDCAEMMGTVFRLFDVLEADAGQ